MENMSDGEKQKRYIDERDRIRDQRGRRKRAPFHLLGFSGMVIGILVSVTGVCFIIHTVFPNMIWSVPIFLAIAVFIAGILLLIISDRFGRRKF